MNLVAAVVGAVAFWWMMNQGVSVSSGVNAGAAAEVTLKR